MFKVGTYLVELTPLAAPSHNFTQTALGDPQSYFGAPHNQHQETQAGIYSSQKKSMHKDAGLHAWAHNSVTNLGSICG